jgi:DNA mismatch repair ATPase MutS
MKVDKTTLKDIGLYDSDDFDGLISHLNYANTNGGRIQFEYYFQNPLSSIEKIKEREATITCFESELSFLDAQKISNGTLLVIDKYFETSVKAIPKDSNLWNTYIYKWFNKGDYSLVKYSVEHCALFIIELNKWQKQFKTYHQNKTITNLCSNIEHILENEYLSFLQNETLLKNPSYILTLGHFFQHHFKHSLQALQNYFYEIDALYSMAKAKSIHHFVIPNWSQNGPEIQFENAFHPLVASAVPNSVLLNKNTNFLFLTGANMAGKSTFIKTIGVGVYLAHIGIGVPATKASISFFDGLITNLNISDNILKGESYFYNEVQRIKKTVQQVNSGEHYCVLIDELFKGTNIIDAMKCSTIVVEGLQKVHSSLFVLSTHLYEISEKIEHHKNIDFKYFETNVQGNELSFQYTLKEGVSQDRIGYLILEREGVVELLQSN